MSALQHSALRPVRAEGLLRDHLDGIALVVEVGIPNTD